METHFTPFRRFIADYQGYIVVCLAILLACVFFLKDMTLNTGLLDMFCYLVLLLLVVFAFIAQYTARNRDRYLQIVSTSVHMLGGQRLVDKVNGILVSKIHSRPYIRDFIDINLTQFSLLLQRLGYKPSLLGK